MDSALPLPPIAILWWRHHSNNWYKANWSEKLTFGGGGSKVHYCPPPTTVKMFWLHFWIVIMLSINMYTRKNRDIVVKKKKFITIWEFVFLNIYFMHIHQNLSGQLFDEWWKMREKKKINPDWVLVSIYYFHKSREGKIHFNCVNDLLCF